MKHQNFRLRGAIVSTLAARLAAGSVAAALCLPAVAVAQTTQTAPTGQPAAGGQAAGLQLEDVVVTARKVEENLQQIPVAVTALTAEAIEARNIQGLEDVARFTPGFSFENFTGPLAAPIIRGQTQTRVDLPVQNVASFFNGVYLQRNYMIDASLLDVERIEIIKGPQSALYGRNAFSGAINYISKKPGDRLEASASATVGNNERRELKGSISGPLASWLGASLAIGTSEFDGTWRNNHPLASQGTGTRDNVGGHDNDAALVGLTIKPLEGLTFDAAFSWSSLDVEHQPGYTVSVPGLLSNVNTLNCSALPGLSAGPPSPLPAGTPIPGSTQNRLYCGELPVRPTLSPGLTSTTPAQPSELSGPFARPAGVVIDPRAYSQRGISRLGSFKATWDLTEQLSLNYLGGWTETDVKSRGSPARNSLVSAVVQPFGPFAPINGFTGFDAQPNGAFTSRSHELRVEWRPGSMVRRAMLGGFVSRARDDLSQWSTWGPPNSLAEPSQTLTLGNNTRRDEVTSAFGLVTLDFTDRFAVTGEVRWTKEELTLQVRANSPTGIAPAVLPFPVAFDASAPIGRTQFADFDYVTPRLAVDFKLTPDNLLYASGGKGVKSGGQNPPGRDPLQDTYEPEENWTIELGSKNDLFDNRLRLNVALYRIDWTGIQGSVARNYPPAARPDCAVNCAVPLPGQPVAVIVGNLGDATVTGIEIDGAWLATDWFTVDYSLAYQQAEYDDGQISQRAANSENCDGIVCAATTQRDATGRPLNGANIGGNQVERQPEVKGAVGFEARFQPAMFGNAEWRARLDTTYQSKQYVDELNLAWVPARTLVDASISAKWGNFSARLWAKNLFDEEYVTTSLFLIGTDGRRSASYVPLLGEQRTYGLTFGWRY